MTPQLAAEILRKMAHLYRSEPFLPKDQAEVTGRAAALEMGAAALEATDRCPHCGAERESER